MCIHKAANVMSKSTLQMDRPNVPHLKHHNVVFSQIKIGSTCAQAIRQSFVLNVKLTSSRKAEIGNIFVVFFVGFSLSWRELFVIYDAYCDNVEPSKTTYCPIKRSKMQ